MQNNAILAHHSQIGCCNLPISMRLSFFFQCNKSHGFFGSPSMVAAPEVSVQQSQPLSIYWFLDFYIFIVMSNQQTFLQELKQLLFTSTST